jgi:hypothetical protein
MTTWTKADIKRMQSVLDLVGKRASDALPYEADDEHRDRVNAALLRQAKNLVFDGMLLPHKDEREVKANARIRERLLTEELPPEIIVPQVVTHREVVASLREQDEQEAARVEALNAQPERVVYQADPERERRVIAFNLTDLRTRGEVQLSRPTSEAFGTSITWDDLKPVTWQTWACDAAIALSCVDAWDKHTASAELIEAARRPLGVVFARACETLTLPDVLDMRGAPEQTVGGRMLSSAWVDALAVALRKAKLGIVLIVDFNPEMIARCLPSRVGQ